MILSIKRFLDKKDDGTESAAVASLRMIHLLLNGTAMHAVELDQSDYEEFRDDILRLDKELGEQPSDAQLMVVTGAVLQQIEDYSRRITRIAKMESAELQRMVAMLADTVGTLAAGNDASVKNLQSISKQIERTKEVDDLRLIKSRLADCLESVQQETIQRRSESALILTKLKEDLAHTRERMSEGAAKRDARDGLTGFADRGEAEKHLAAALQENPNLNVAVFVVQRLPLINTRFGYPAGDQMLNHFGTHLRDSLHAADLVFRWGGPCFVATLERSVPMGEVRTELASISNARIEKTIKAGSRSAMLPISSLWSVFNLRELRTMEDVCKKIEQFASLTHHGPQS